VKHAVPGKLGYLYYFNVGRFIWNFFGVFPGIFFTDIKKPKEKNVRFSGANNYSLGAGAGGWELHFSYVTATAAVVVVLEIN